MIEIYGKDNCAFCDRAKQVCETKGLEYVYHKLGEAFTRDELIEMFPNARTFPQVKIDGIAIGGYKELYEQVG